MLSHTIYDAAFTPHLGSMLSSVIQGTAEVRILSMVKESNAYMAHRN